MDIHNHHLLCDILIVIVIYSKYKSLIKHLHQTCPFLSIYLYAADDTVSLVLQLLVFLSELYGMMLCHGLHQHS